VSFSLTALGTKEEVIKQLQHQAKNQDMIKNSPVAIALVQLLSSELEKDAPSVYKDHEMRYHVSASGHSGGGSAMSLSVTVNPAYTPATTTHSTTERE
jgi:hypothetical protein